MKQKWKDRIIKPLVIVVGVVGWLIIQINQINMKRRKKHE